MSKWIIDGDVFKGEIGGGDEQQCTKSYDVRFILADDDGIVRGRQHTDHGDPRHGPLGENTTETLYSLVTVTYYGVTKYDEDGKLDLDSDGEPVIWIREQVESMVCTNPGDPGSTERWSRDDPQHEHDRFFHNFPSAERAARMMAERYTKDPELIERDIDWDGLAPWERN